MPQQRSFFSHYVSLLSVEVDLGTKKGKEVWIFVAIKWKAKLVKEIFKVEYVLCADPPIPEYSPEHH